jgi:methylmalonic aciduria homocystinuria type C protein
MTSPLSTTWQQASEQLSDRLIPLGFEVLGAVASSAYNASLDDKLAAYRVALSLGDGPSVALVVGNTKRLWPLFLEAFASTPLGDEAHPLDAYSRRHISAAAAHLASELGVAHETRFSFDPPPNTVAIQRLAALAGAAELAPIGLCVHPVYGPWFSLRAAVVLALPGPAPSASAPTCTACAGRPCMGPREKVMAMGAAGVSRELLAEHWETWLAMRDACPIGRDVRYSDAQVRYHYLKDRALLRLTR